MLRSVPLTPPQESRLQQFSCLRTVDMHCHVLPKVDDGPKNLSDAIALCRALIADGFTDIIATPHQLGRWDGSNPPIAIRASVADLQIQIDKARLPLTIHAGAEVRLDERIPQFLGAGKILTLGDNGVHLLVELPLGMTVNPDVLVPFITKAGTKMVLAHAERYDSLTSDPRMTERWVKHGVALQVNATSLCEETPASRIAWGWMERGWIALVASDAHSTNSRRPRMSEAMERIINRAGSEAARRICIENPVRALEGRELLLEG